MALPVEEVPLVAVEVEAHRNDAVLGVVEELQHGRDHDYDYNAREVHEDVAMAAVVIADLHQEDRMTLLLVAVVEVEGQDMRLAEDLVEVVDTQRQSTYRVETYLVAAEDPVSDTRRRDLEDDP